MNAPATKPFIILCEDEPALLRMTSKMLETIAEVHAFEDGRAALDFLEQGGRVPHLVVTDVMMPRMDGLELVKRLKADARFSKVPFIMLTAKSGPKDVVTGINAGVRHYITKPFKTDELLTKVKKTLGIA